MGKIKEKATNAEKEFTLTDAEFNYLANMNTSMQNRQAEDRRVITAFLYYIATSRLGYEAGQNLKFEVDFEADGHPIKISTY